MSERAPAFVGMLGASKVFLGDYLLAVIGAATFCAVGSLDVPRARLLAVRHPIALAISYTFSIYLYHAPLLALLLYGLKLPSWSILPALFAGNVVIGYLTERNLPSFRVLLARWTGLSSDESQATGTERQRSGA